MVAVRSVSAEEADLAIQILNEDGAVIIAGLFSTHDTDAVAADIRPSLDDQSPGGGAFYGQRAKRVSGVLALSSTAQGMVADDVLIKIGDAVLGPHCANFRLQLLSALEVWSGGDPQPLHRDAGVYEPYLAISADKECMFTVMLAGTDFTETNGGTRIALGSHRWDPERKAKDDEIAQVTMERGSVAIWLGSTLHGMGVNKTDKPRLGVVWGYSLGWLRQEQETILVMPPALAARLPEKVRRIIGYQSHGPLLGWVAGNDPTQNAPSTDRTRSFLLA
jgi:ectoine hydroxylase-related dioxygenase (phytanoyl-CoA dioxygenase family)